MDLNKIEPYYQNELSTVYNNDCRTMDNFIPNKSIDLIFSDPPFNNSSKYSNWNDNLSENDYIKFTNEWLGQSLHSLKEG